MLEEVAFGLHLGLTWRREQESTAEAVVSRPESGIFHQEFNLQFFGLPLLNFLQGFGPREPAGTWLVLGGAWRGAQGGNRRMFKPSSVPTKGRRLWGPPLHENQKSFHAYQTLYIVWELILEMQFSKYRPGTCGLPKFSEDLRIQNSFYNNTTIRLGLFYAHSLTRASIEVPRNCLMGS